MIDPPALLVAPVRVAVSVTVPPTMTGVLGAVDMETTAGVTPSFSHGALAGLLFPSPEYVARKL